MCKSWCQSFNLGAHHYFDFKGHGSWVKFLVESCFVFVCLFVFQLPRWVIILFLSLTSGWGFLFFFFFFFFVCFVFCLFCFLFVCFVFCLCFCCCCCCCCFVLFFLQNVQFPHHICRVRLIFFFFVSPVGKVFCFLLFLFVCFYFILFYFIFVLFCFVLFCFVLFLLPKIPPPLISNPYSITQMMVDTTSSTILNSHAIQWKI